MEFAFGDAYRDGPLALGIRRKRSYYEVATPSNCALIPGDFAAILTYVLQYCRESGETFYHRKRHTGTLRHLTVRCGEFTGQLLVNLVTTAETGLDTAAMARGITGLALEGQVNGVLHSLNDGVADAVKNENVRIVTGCDHFHEKINGLAFRISAFSFFQTNSAGAEVLYSVVREMAGEGRLACDLYCGTGTIAQIIAPSFERVVGIELVPEAIAAAKINAQLNHILNCEFYVQDLTRVPGGGEAGLFTGEPPDAIVVDPPRDGLAPKTLARVAALAPRRIVYVACKPASLARDLPLLKEAGYTPVRIAGVDLFPRTPHTELVCFLH
jgi:23S rRNA (uracil-5-)-methyltransferase RumA